MPSTRGFCGFKAPSSSDGPFAKRSRFPAKAGIHLRSVQDITNGRSLPPPRERMAYSACLERNARNAIPLTTRFQSEVAQFSARLRTNPFSLSLRSLRPLRDPAQHNVEGPPPLRLGRKAPRSRCSSRLREGSRSARNNDGLRLHQAPRDNPFPPRYKSHPVQQGLAGQRREPLRRHRCRWSPARIQSRAIGAWLRGRL